MCSLLEKLIEKVLRRCVETLRFVVGDLMYLIYINIKYFNLIGTSLKNGYTLNNVLQMSIVISIKKEHSYLGLTLISGLPIMVDLYSIL